MTGKSQEQVTWEEAEEHWYQAQADAQRRNHLKAMLLAQSDAANQLLAQAEEQAIQAYKMLEQAKVTRDLALATLDMAEQLCEALSR